MLTDQEKLDALERELKYRRRVYPRLVAAGKMTASFAAKQERIFEEIAEDYRDRVKDGELI